jgi:hypothetical protein
MFRGATMMAEIDTFVEEFIFHRHAWILLALLGIGFALWCVLSCLLPHDRYIRYQQPQLAESYLFRTRWVYERIHFDKTPIDVAVVGSSRVEGAISGPVLETELSEKLRRPIHVVNFAIPNEGRNLHYLLTRELLENHPETRILLVSVGEWDDMTHPSFRYLADVSDLLRAPLLINHFYFLDAAFLPLRQMSYFLQTYMPSWFGMSRSFRKDYLGTVLDTTYSFHLPDGTLVDRYRMAPRQELAAASRHMIAELGCQWHPRPRWEALNNPLETEYTRRLVTIAQQHCVEVIFVHIPLFNSIPNMYDKAFYSGLGPVLDAQQYNDNPDDYADGVHVNHYGAEVVAKWLKSSIDPYLRPLENSDSCPNPAQSR